MLKLDTHWIWDSWSIDHGPDHHLYFLKAPRSLGDPELRHYHPTVGHAVSSDYRTWTLLPDALTPGPQGSWDDLTVWTGSVVRGVDRWHMFYTGGSRAEKARVQRIGRADSTDLITWRRCGTEPVVEADARWYERLGDSDWPEEAWRDPWVFADPDGHGWHMLITARSRHGPAATRGVIGHAWSSDLARWEVRPPLSVPTGFGHLEVLQVADLGTGQFLVFSAAGAAEQPQVWTVPIRGPLGPFDLQTATRVGDESLYAARLIRTGPSDWALLGFRNVVDGEFGGFIDEPRPVRITASGELVVQPG